MINWRAASVARFNFRARSAPAWGPARRSYFGGAVAASGSGARIA